MVRPRCELELLYFPSFWVAKLQQVTLMWICSKKHSTTIWDHFITVCIIYICANFKTSIQTKWDSLNYPTSLHCPTSKDHKLHIHCQVNLKQCPPRPAGEMKVKVEVKSSCYRPGVAQRVPGGLGSQIFMVFGTWRWWSRQPNALAPFTPRNVPSTHFH